MINRYVRPGHRIDKKNKKSLKNWKKENNKKNTKNVMNSLLLNLTLGVVFFHSLGMCRALDKRAIH